MSKLKNTWIHISLSALGLGLASNAAANVITFETAPTGRFNAPVTEDGFTISRDTNRFPGLPQADVQNFGNPGRALVINPACATLGQNPGPIDGFVITAANPGSFTFSGIDYRVSSNLNPQISVSLTVFGLVGGSSVGQTTYAAKPSSGWTSFGAGALAGITVDSIKFSIGPGANGTCLGPIGGLEFDYGQLVDNIRLEPVTPMGGVPEPATWAFIIAGFGLIGGALRWRGLTEVVQR